MLPHKGQARGWSKKDRKIYSHILARADEAVYTSEYYYTGCMHKRNRCLIDNSEVCLCYLTAEKGGTAYTVGYAREKRLRIINLALD